MKKTFSFKLYLEQRKNTRTFVRVRGHTWQAWCACRARPAREKLGGGWGDCSKPP